MLGCTDLLILEVIINDHEYNQPYLNAAQMNECFLFITSLKQDTALCHLKMQITFSAKGAVTESFCTSYQILFCFLLFFSHLPGVPSI